MRVGGIFEKRGSWQSLDLVLVYNEGIKLEYHQERQRKGDASKTRKASACELQGLKLHLFCVSK